MKLTNEQKKLKERLKFYKHTDVFIEGVNGQIEFWQKMRNTMKFIRPENHEMEQKILEHERFYIDYKLKLEEHAIMIKSWLKTLTETEYTIIHSIYNLGEPLLSVANKLNYSERQVKRIHQSAILKLESYLKEDV